MKHLWPFLNQRLEGWAGGGRGSEEEGEKVCVCVCVCVCENCIWLTTEMATVIRGDPALWVRKLP